MEETLPEWLTHFENWLGRNSSKNFMVGDGVTFVDYVLVELLSVHLNLDPACLVNFPLLQNYHKRIYDRPGIQKYVYGNKRPERVNGKGAWWDCWLRTERPVRPEPWF